MAGYVPDRGDFVQIDLNPQQGREQSGHRPTLVISPQAQNRKTSLCVVCPATRQAKGYPFEVSVRTADGFTSVILADHAAPQTGRFGVHGKSRRSAPTSWTKSSAALKPF